MKPVLKALLLGILLYPGLKPALAALTQDPALHWRTLYTEHFAIHFHDGEDALARRVGAIAETVHDRLTRKYRWTPQQRTEVVLSDRFDYSNGAATPFTRNTTYLLVTPPAGNSVISDHDGWLELLITHEYTHILHLDKVGGFPARLRKILGRNPLLFPNLLQPQWLIEGLATYEETDRTRAIGRGQSTLFRGLMRMEVASGIKPVQQVNQPLESWPMNTVRYLYGAYFYQYIAERYGPEKITELVERYSNNLLPFFIGNNSRRVLGKDLAPLWNDFRDHLRTRFSAEIDAIRQAGEISGTALTRSGYFTRSPQLTDDGDIYYLERDLQTEPRLMVLRHGATRPETVAELRGSSIDLHPSAGIVGAEVDAVNNTNQFSDLYHVDPASGEKTRLTHGQRYLQATWSPDGRSIIAVHNTLGQHALHRLDARGRQMEVLWQGSDDTVIGFVDWSPRGEELVASVWRPGTLWNLERFDLRNRRWTPLTHGTDIETTPRYSHDATSIVFSADYDGVFNIYQLTLDDGRLHKLTNVIGQASAPELRRTANGDQLVYINLGANGHDLFRIDPVTPSPVQRETPWRRDASPPRHYPPLQNTRTEPYSALERITPTSWFPYFLFDGLRNEIGFSTFGWDPLQRHSYSALLGYDVNRRWGLGQVNYVYDRWNPTLKFTFDRQVLAFLDDNFDRLDRYRNADLVTAEAVWPFFRYQRQWLLHAGLVHEQQSDKLVLSSLGPAPTTTNRLAGLAVSYNSARYYARSISPSYGRQLRVVAEDNDLFQNDFSGQTYSLDWREFIDLPGKHVAALRTVVGWGTDAPQRFRLGGPLDSSVAPAPQAAALAPTHGIFGQRRYPLRGYSEGVSGLRGRRMALIEAEWRFPIGLIERGAMAPPLGVHQLHGKLFYNWGAAWDRPGSIPPLRRGAGAEITAQLVLGYWLPLDLRAGYALGFDAHGTEQIYLELGGSF